MADVAREEDEWLYGENAAEDQIKLDPEQADKLLQDDDETTGPAGENEQAAANGVEQPGERGVLDDTAADEFLGDGAADDQDDKGSDEGDGDDDDDDDEDSDDDGVQVVIGDLKAGAPGAFGAAKRAAGPPPDKKGKFSVEDFETPGTINGVPAIEFSIDTLEEKPWRKPGADITDYFNYGFTEETWRAYCDRQKRMRYETGAMLTNPMAKIQGTPGVIISDGQKLGAQSNIIFPKKFGQQQFVRKDGQPMMIPKQEPKENTIQVRVINTIERRDNFGRKGYDMPPPNMPPPFDMSVPPPVFRHPPGPGYMGPPPPDFFNRPPPGFYQEEEEMPGYEEQQWMDSQWEMEGSGIGPSSSVSVIPLTKAPVVPPPPGEGDGQDSSTLKSEPQ